MEDPIKQAERMLRFWQKRLDELKSQSVNGVNATENEERKEAGEKEKSPHTPLKGKEGEEKREEKDNNHDYAGARGREDKLRQQRIAEVEAFRAKIGSDIDPEVFVDYYLSNHRGWPKEWQARFRNWGKNDKRGGRLSSNQLKESKSTRSYSLADWTLCAERCAAFREGKCTCGIKTPPNCDNKHPMPPEECPHFQEGSAI